MKIAAVIFIIVILVSFLGIIITLEQIKPIQKDLLDTKIEKLYIEDFKEKNNITNINTSITENRISELRKDLLESQRPLYIYITYIFLSILFLTFLTKK